MSEAVSTREGDGNQFEQNTGEADTLCTASSCYLQHLRQFDQARANHDTKSCSYKQILYYVNSFPSSNTIMDEYAYD